MIITCQNCRSQYYLARQELFPDGRKLKCSKCKIIWFQEYVAAPKITFDKFSAKSFNLKKGKIFLPAVIKSKKPIWAPICATILFSIALVLSIVFFQDDVIKKYSGISSFYDRAGIPSIRGMKIHAVEVSTRKDSQIDINGIVENNSGAYKRVPPMVIFLFNEKNALLKTIFIPAAPKYLGKGSKYAFYKKIKNDFKTKPKAVSLALASSTEVFFHSLDFR